MKATKIYRDNFVYNINTPLCEKHARDAWNDRSQYAYIEKIEHDAECSHCKSEIRSKAYKANRIHWFMYSGSQLVFESKDRQTFWNYIKQTKIDRQDYEVKEILL